MKENRLENMQTWTQTFPRASPGTPPVPGFHFRMCLMLYLSFGLCVFKAIALVSHIAGKVLKWLMEGKWHLWFRHLIECRTEMRKEQFCEMKVQLNFVCLWVWPPFRIIFGLPSLAQWKRSCLPIQKPQETWVWFMGLEDPLEEEMATRSSILAWRIPGTEEPGRLQSMGSQQSWTQLSN